MSQQKSQPKTKPNSKKASRPVVSIVGSGRLGQALAIALRSAGYSVEAFVARRAGQARKAARHFDPDKPVGSLSLDQLEQLPASDLILITVPDDAIESTAETLAAVRARNGHASQTVQTVLHTSGALASDVLNSLAMSGFHTGSLHPLVSVSEPMAGAEALHGAFFCLEGDKIAMRVGRRIVSDLQGKSFSIQPENKALYHAAAVMASGHLTALFDLATEMLVACGISQRNARRILLLLVESAVNNLKASNPEHALTGTFARGDFATVQRHLKALSRKELAARLPEALAVYKLLGLRSLHLANKKKFEPQLLERIREVLEYANAHQK